MPYESDFAYDATNPGPDDTDYSPLENPSSPGDTGGDVFFTYVDAVTSSMADDQAIAQYMNVGFPSVNMTTGQNIPGAPTNTGVEANTGKNDKTLVQRIMESDRALSAAITVGGGALSGLGAGYMAGKKQDDANKIAQQQIDINARLATSQEALNKSKTNQDLSGFRFNQPRGLIDSAQKPWQPAPQVDVTKRWRTA